MIIIIIIITIISALDANEQADILEKRANSKKGKVRTETQSSSSKKRTA